MTRDDIIRMAREAGGCFENLPLCDAWLFYEDEHLERFAALVAAEKEQQMTRDGWRQCAKGQRTTQFCWLLDAAVKAEREACAKVCEEDGLLWGQRYAAAIRARGEEQPYATQAAMVESQTHGRMQIDPATGNVSIGAIRARGEA